ncbi:MAG: PP2C family protein-serine/threonine phosphatase [Flavobacteriales bacterium]
MNIKLPIIDWKQELEKSTQKYHLITCWVGVIFNLLFFAADYLTLPEYWMPFLVFRSTVSILIFLAIVGYKKGKIPVELLGVIPVVLISIENAYMWSFMDVAQFQKHTFAYMALFIGSGMFVLYRNLYSIIIVGISLVANIVLLNVNSSLSFDEIMVNGGLLTFAVAMFSMFLIRTRFNLTKKEVVSRLALKASHEELSIKKEIIEEKNKEITDSIQYAKRIQQALITPEDILKKIVPDSFVFFQPKDIVSGDFYWVAELSTTKENEDNEKLCVFSVADCTGHGVPGAFMSLIGIKILNQSIKEKNINSPAEALDFVNTQVFDTVNKHSDEKNIVRDGMDAVLFAINFNTFSLSFAGANNSLYIVRDKEIIELKGDKQPIGTYSNQNKFTNIRFQLQKNDVVYASTDGFPDQFGGQDGKKLKTKRFKEKLIECSALSVDEQKNELQKYFNSWKGNLEQLDDICVLGIKI